MICLFCSVATSRKIPDATGKTSTYIRSFIVEPDTGLLLSAQAGLALPFSEPERALEEFLVDLHVRLHVPDRWGLYLTGLLGIALLVAAITGVLIHRHIIREMFLAERPGNRLVSVRDRHNLAGVWSLPFAIVLAFTGAFLSFAISLGLPVVAFSAFAGDQQKALDAVVQTHIAEDATPAEFLDLETLLENARNQADGLGVTVVGIRDYGRADAVVTTQHGRPSGHLRGLSLAHSGTTGEYLGKSHLVGNEESVGNTLAGLMTPLHYGNFAGKWSKITWAALGAAMTYTIVTGLQLWLRRRAANPNWAAGPKAMSVVIWGLPLAMMGSVYGYFFSRLTGDVERWTTDGFLIAMCLVLLFPVIWRTDEVQVLSLKLRKLLGALLLFTPVLRLQTGGMSWGEALVFGGWDILFIEFLCVLLGVICLGGTTKFLRLGLTLNGPYKHSS